jgi:RimJ/RimL family protein N-acetyltransferase
MLKVRKVVASDCDWLFELSNDEMARKFSYSSEPIPYPEHYSWFQKQLDNPDSVIFVFIMNEDRVGIVRFVNEKLNWVVGINLNKNFRGKGLAPKMLNLALSELNPGIPVFAYIKKNNESSIKTFNSAGFQYEKEISVQSIPSYLYIWK